jgi:hypothetical protein
MFLTELIMGVAAGSCALQECKPANEALGAFEKE